MGNNSSARCDTKKVPIFASCVHDGLNDTFIQNMFSPSSPHKHRRTGGGGGGGGGSTKTYICRWGFGGLNPPPAFDPKITVLSICFSFNQE